MRLQEQIESAKKIITHFQSISKKEFEGILAYNLGLWPYQCRTILNALEQAGIVSVKNKEISIVKEEAKGIMALGSPIDESPKSE